MEEISLLARRSTMIILMEWSHHFCGENFTCMISFNLCYHRIT